jgi:hypothetical protein
MHNFIGPKNRQYVFEGHTPPIKTGEGIQAITFEMTCLFLVNLSCDDAALELGIGVDLRDPDGCIRSVRGEVIVLVVLERPTQWRRSVKACNSVISKLEDMVKSIHA